MPRLQRKNFATPDQVRTFSTGRVDVVTLDEITIGRFVLQLGDLSQRLPRSMEPSEALGRIGRQHGRSTEGYPSTPCGGQSRNLALANEIAF